MARKGVTYDQVANAAAAIKARGTEPTMSGIRVELGDTGSLSTISQHLAKWREQESEKVHTDDLPEELEKVLMTAITQVWNAANKYAQEDVSAIKQEYKDKEKELKKELETAMKEIESLEKESDEGNKENEIMRVSLAKLEKENVELKAQLKATEGLYKELMANLQTKPHDDTKKANQQQSKASSGSKQAASQ